MNCKTAQSSLSAFVDEELTGREMLEMREHLGACPECAEELTCVEALKRLLGAAPVPEPSADFEDRLVSRVLSATYAPGEPKKLSILAVAAIAAASMLGTMLLLNSFHSAPSSVADQRDGVPYDLMQRNHAFDVSYDPLGGSPVVYRGR
jgi:anti-sigma factor RsiW